MRLFVVFIDAILIISLFVLFILLAKFTFSDSILTRLIAKPILFLFIGIIYLYINAKYIQSPLLCEGLTDQFEKGEVVRTPLPLQPGQKIKDLAEGTYDSTGGLIQIGKIGAGSVNQVTGIAVRGEIIGQLNYVPGTQPLNKNFACLLYEIKAGGQHYLNHSSLDYAWSYQRTEHLTPYTGFSNMYFLNSYRVQAGLPVTSYGEFCITKGLINGIAR